MEGSGVAATCPPSSCAFDTLTGTDLIGSGETRFPDGTSKTAFENLAHPTFRSCERKCFLCKHQTGAASIFFSTSKMCL